MDIRKYLCDWELDEDFIDEIDRFAVWRGCNTPEFGNAFFVMKNLDVYAAGVSSSSKNTNKPVLLPSLCGRRIKKFVAEDTRVLVCTEEGEVFGYGSWFSRNKIFIMNMPQKVSSLEGLRIVDIAIGPQSNCLALRDDGKIEVFDFAVPLKYLVDTSPAADTKPLNIFNVTGHIYVSLLENGKMMKIDTSIDDFLPNPSAKKFKKNTCEVMNYPKADAGKIKKIIPGFPHIQYVLDEYGLLFVISYDVQGELKLQEFQVNSCFPEKIVDVAGSRLCSLTAVLTEKGNVYMWGRGRGASISNPTLTPFKTLHEVFLHYSMPLSTYKLMNVDELLSEPSHANRTRTNDQQNFFIDMFKNAFDKQTLCDLFVEVGGNTIPVHKSVLALRCKHFVEVFQKDWPEEKPIIVEIKDGDFKVYKAFLEYLYTDQIDTSLSFNDILELLNLANKYHSEQLAERCVLLIQSNITVESVILLYVRATVMIKDTTMKKIFDQLKDSCVRFTADHENIVVISDEFAKMDSDMARELIIDVCKSRCKN
ncbi:RCC1 and BTB domain-containing protein 1-like [Planococcus citri]|uniref:RCC1 and BTB domain-containing protein 1-like n=1 Tax=Planococcus citri TaxID=170843 RepID=UPI0031F8837D